MIDLLLQMAVLILIPLGLAWPLLGQLANRSGLQPSGWWIISHILAGVLIFGLAWLVLIWLPQPEWLSPASTIGLTAHIGLVELAKLVALLILARVLHTPECGCPDDDDPLPEKSKTPKKASWDPWRSPEPEPWHAGTASWTIGGFIVGASFALLENLTSSNGNLTLLLLRQIGPLILHGASAAMIAWSLARFRAAHHWHPLRVVIAAIALHLVYNLMVSAGFPYFQLSWFMIPPAYIVLWRYAGNTVAVRRPRKKPGRPGHFQ